MLDGILSDKVVEQSLANLETSGIYAQIIASVRDEIEQENAARLQAEEEAEREAAQKAIEDAEKAAKAAAEKKAIFDYEGVSKHLKTPSQIDTFREIVTSSIYQEALPVNKQAALAKALVKEAKDDGKELSARFIRDETTNLLLRSKQEVRKATKEQQERLERQDRNAKANRLLDDLRRALLGVDKCARELIALWKEWPKDESFPVSRFFADKVKIALEALTKLNERMCK
jgi:hypothetical protein